ncbi:hypothetical protein JW960_19935 [candidate division KSB1 bacterium]|nr:hypothetical protein [candidate division KSB1 bacterium]
MKRLLVLSVCLLLTVPLFGQEEDTGTSLTKFVGGTYQVEFSMMNNLFLGVGSRVGSMGGDYGGIYSRSESILWNPANIGWVEQSQWTLDISPAIMIDPGSFVDLDNEIHTAVDDGIADMKAPGFTMQGDDYPAMNMNIGTKCSFGTGSFVLRGPYFNFGAALIRPFDMSMSLLGTGTKAKIESGDGEDPALAVTMYTTIDLSVASNIHVQGWTMGAARKITPRWTAGFSMERLSGMADLNGKFQINGIMVTAGNERAFNNPDDPWENSLSSSMYGQYEGHSTTFKFGSTFKLNPNWGIGTVLAMAKPLKMAGDMTIKQRTLAALNLGAEGDEEILDVTSNQFDLAEPTRTVIVDNPTSKTLTLNMPSYFGLGITGKMGFFGLSLNYNQYFGEFSYEYNFVRNQGLGNEEQVNYAQGIRLSNSIRFGLDFKIFRLGAGAMMGTMFNDNDPESEDKSMIVPSFTLGTGFHITRQLGVDLLLLGVPTGVGKITLTYAM